VDVLISETVFGSTVLIAVSCFLCKKIQMFIKYTKVEFADISTYIFSLLKYVPIGKIYFGNCGAHTAKSSKLQYSVKPYRKAEIQDLNLGVIKRLDRGY